MPTTAFVYNDLLSRHSLGETHPLKPARLRYTYELLNSYGAFDAPTSSLIAPRQATIEEVLWYHTETYVDAVRRVGIGDTSVNKSQFNFGPGDNPIFDGMYDTALWSTGASLRAVELLVSDHAEVAFSIAGGLHHAMPGYASGFCVFNDPAIAIKALLDHNLRVAYVDIDCHHGDGVQHAFYNTDEVLTISVHESGKFIFPGTGSPQETGVGKGMGHSVNLPLYPYTTNQTFLWAFREVVPPLLEAFKPDVLVSQLGIDSHFRDPITHLALTIQGFGEAIKLLRDVAPKWLAMGGGGYDLQTVARAWATAYGIMSRQELPNDLPNDYREEHGGASLADVGEPSVPNNIAQNTKAFAENSVLSVQRLIFPTHGLHV